MYRLVSKNTIEERILHRAKQKAHIQKMVISGDQASSAFKGGGNESFKASGLCVVVVVKFSYFLVGKDTCGLQQMNADRLQERQCTQKGVCMY